MEALAIRGAEEGREEGVVVHVLQSGVSLRQFRLARISFHRSASDRMDDASLPGRRILILGRQFLGEEEFADRRVRYVSEVGLLHEQLSARRWHADLSRQRPYPSVDPPGERSGRHRGRRASEDVRREGARG